MLVDPNMHLLHDVAQSPLSRLHGNFPKRFAWPWLKCVAFDAASIVSFLKSFGTGKKNSAGRPRPLLEAAVFGHTHRRVLEKNSSSNVPAQRIGLWEGCRDQALGLEMKSVSFLSVSILFLLVGDMVQPSK